MWIPITAINSIGAILVYWLKCTCRCQTRVEQLPAYSPDFNPIEHLWKKVKKEAPQLKYFPEFPDLQAEVNRALLHFAQTPSEITVLMARDCEKLGRVVKAA
ncbi:hypothetical protein C2W62_34510 [Candidatus Entotheonella serta]|nr:hypothetical protein C2W62_34510 [Candidatus Entotheonella serta]